MGPPSSGGSTVLEALNILEGFPAADETETFHRYIEASRYAFADRNAYVADPAYFDVPLRGLLSKGFAGERRALIGERDAGGPVDPGNPYDDSRETTGGQATAVHPGQSTTNLTWSTATATPSTTRSRSSPPAAAASSSPGTASCSTTS
jgi:gamma-glutamyltranspeptidase/glutathione hydrolase